MSKGSCSGSGISFSSHVSLVSGLEELPTLSFWRLQVNYFGECPLIWVCLVFPIRFISCIFGRGNTEMMLIPLAASYQVEGGLYTRCGWLSLLTMNQSSHRSLKSICMCVGVSHFMYFSLTGFNYVWFSAFADVSSR